MWGPETQLAGPQSPRIPLLPGGSAHSQGGLWTEKGWSPGSVSVRRRKGWQGQGGVSESLGSRHPAGGNLAVPTISAGAGLGEVGGRQESLGILAGKEGQEGFTHCGSWMTPYLTASGLQNPTHSHANPFGGWEAGPQTVQSRKIAQGQEKTKGVVFCGRDRLAQGMWGRSAVKAVIK